MKVGVILNIFVWLIHIFVWLIHIFVWLNRFIDVVILTPATPLPLCIDSQTEIDIKVINSLLYPIPFLP